MAIEDVLDQRQAQPGAALGAALRHIDPIEALGQPRQMLGSDARTTIAHRNARFRFAIRPLPAGQRDVHPLAGRRVFQRVLHEILEHADQFVAIGRHEQRRGDPGRLDLDIAVARQCLQAIGHLPNDGAEIDLLVGPQMRVEFDARERQEIVDQTRHTVGLHLHDGEEALARRRILARRPAQRIDEPRQRGKRRAQLVAGIGNEVGAHLLDPPQWREVVERKQQEAGPGVGPARQYRGHDGFVPTVERHALEEFGALGCPARARVADRLQHLRHAQPERDRLARPQRGCNRGGPHIERHHVAAMVERDHGIRQSGQHRLDQRIADTRRARLISRQQRRRRFRARGRDQHRRGDECEAGERRSGVDRTEQPQGAERERRRRKHEARALEPIKPSGGAGRAAVVSRCHVTRES